MPAPVDLLLGTDLYHHVFDGKQINGSDGNSEAYSSIFGWILIGSVHHSPSVPNHSFFVSLTTSLEDLLVKF